jgi:hypothetical protein
LISLPLDEFDVDFEVFRLFKEAEAAYMERQKMESEARRHLR